MFYFKWAEKMIKTVRLDVDLMKTKQSEVERKIKEKIAQ